AARFLDRRQRVKTVELIQIDVVGAEPAQASLDGVDQVIPRRAHLVGAGASAEGPLRGNQDLMAASLESLSQDLLCLSARIHVRRIKHGGAGIETEIDETHGRR